MRGKTRGKIEKQTKKCVYCGREFKIKPMGKHRIYCSSTCKTSAYVKRQRANSAARDKRMRMAELIWVKNGCCGLEWLKLFGKGKI